jgi:hypothetical protein
VLHIMARVQIRNPSAGRDYYDRKKTDGKAPMEAMRCVKRKLSDIVYQQMLNDAVRHQETGPGGQQGNDSDSSATSSHPHAGSSDKPLPGPATTKPKTRSGRRVDTEGSHVSALPARTREAPTGDDWPLAATRKTAGRDVFARQPLLRRELGLNLLPIVCWLVRSGGPGCPRSSRGDRWHCGEFDRGDILALSVQRDQIVSTQELGLP